jgi:aspartate carbamoyltransferase catalytic subunit
LRSLDFAISCELCKAAKSCYSEQAGKARHGVAIRMAVVERALTAIKEK